MINNILIDLEKGFSFISQISLEQRAQIIKKTAELLEKEAEEFIFSLCQEIFKPKKQAEFEVKETIDFLKLCSETYLNKKDIYNSLDSNLEFKTINEPLGIVVAISAYNFPLIVSANKIAPALIAGNSVFFKPSPKAINTSKKFAELFLKAGLNQLCLLTLNISNQDLQELCSNPRIAFVNFTGSAQIGWQLKTLIRPQIPCIFELGGNAPVIVHKDANIKKAAESCALGAFSFSGQSCISTQRVYVHKEIINNFEFELIKATKKLKIANAFEEDTDFSDMISEEAVKKIHEKVLEAINSGAEIILGGKILNKISSKCYSPTIIKNVNENLSIMQEEIFGPVLCLNTYENLEEVIKKANNSNFGLSAGIFTKDLSLGENIAKQLDFATVMINNSSAFRSNKIPVPTRKFSGIGTEGIIDSVNLMSKRKVIIRN